MEGAGRVTVVAELIDRMDEARMVVFDDVLCIFPSWFMGGSILHRPY